MNGTKEITPIQYAWYAGCSVQNVRKNYKNTGLKHLDHVLDVKHYSRFYLFIVPETLDIPTKDPKRRKR